MINAYINPPPLFLRNQLFARDKAYNGDDWLQIWRAVKEECKKNDINFNTVDYADYNNPADTDVYITLGHRDWLYNYYQHFRNPDYPIINPKKFKKRILIQFEPPLVNPKAFTKIDQLRKVYDKMIYSVKTGSRHCQYVLHPKTYDDIIPKLWEKKDRKFLCMVNINKKPKRLKFQRLYFGLLKPFPLQKEIISDRLEIIKFFSNTGDMDLYGIGWDKRPPFPFWGYKKYATKIWKGPVESKFETIANYTFTIATEHGIAPGFVGEAMIDCLAVGTIPIYLGAPDITEFVPKNCFIDMRDFKNYEELRQYLKDLSAEEIEQYRQNGKNFLRSAKYDPFRKQKFAELIVKLIKE